MKTKTDTCTRCGGAGTVEERHPLWGARNCPDPTVEIVCPRCNGAGQRKHPHYLKEQ